LAETTCTDIVTFAKLGQLKQVPDMHIYGIIMGSTNFRGNWAANKGE
jgi:hypothetical protein